MPMIQSTQSPTVLVAIDIAKLRHEVLVQAPGSKSRKRLVLLNTAIEFRRLADTGGHHAVVKFLLDAGADSSRRDESGYTAADAASNRFDPVFTQLYREWGMPDRYSPEVVEDDWEPSGDFAYFLSYRHGRFAQIAAELANKMKQRGQRTFIDQTELEILESEMLPRSLLKARLAKAIRYSRTLVFFESYLDSGPHPGDRFYSFRWQFFELLNAREALFVSIDQGLCRRWILVPGKRVELADTLFSFSGISELSNMLMRRDWDGGSTASVVR